MLMLVMKSCNAAELDRAVLRTSRKAAAIEQDGGKDAEGPNGAKANGTTDDADGGTSAPLP